MPLQVDGTGGITKEGIPFLEDLLSIGKDDLLLLTAPYSSDPNSKNKMYRQFYEKKRVSYFCTFRYRIIVGAQGMEMPLPNKVAFCRFPFWWPPTLAAKP